jgi:hypothetical protein
MALSSWPLALCFSAIIAPTLKLQEIQNKTKQSFTGKSAGATKSTQARAPAFHNKSEVSSHELAVTQTKAPKQQQTEIEKSHPNETSRSTK